jgi:hypothetical protein
MNKTIAGYHILMILSAVDFRFHVKEDLIIRDWLAKEFPAKVDLDKEMEIISGLLPTHWDKHFDECIEYYYQDANQKERQDIIEFSKKLVLADEILYKSEHVFFNTFLDVWKEKGVIAEDQTWQNYLLTP